MAAETTAGETMAGETMAGETMAGERGAGTPADEEARAADEARFGGDREDVRAEDVAVETSTGDAAPTSAAVDDQGEPDEAAKREAEEESRRKAAEFAAQHDPAQHDVAAGEEFRQSGDWTAEETGGPPVWDAEGSLVDGAGPGLGAGSGGGGGGAAADPGGARRISELEEVVDGGYGIGSAAPIEDGAMPLGHPVEAWEDTKTFVAQGYPGYGDAEPHVWFLDAEAARRAGFSPAGG